MYSSYGLATIPPTYSHSRHPTGDHVSYVTGTRQDPCPHAPDLNSSSIRLRSLASYPRQALCPRIALPIQGIRVEFLQVVEKVE